MERLRKHIKNYGPIMVQQLFLNVLNAPLEAIRVAQFQLVTSKWGAVTALSGSFGNRWAAGGMRGNHREFGGFQRGGVVQLVRTPACHAGGRGFESRRSRHSFAVTRFAAAGPK